MGSRVRVPPRSPSLTLQNNNFCPPAGAAGKRVGTNKSAKGTNSCSADVLALVGRRSGRVNSLRLAEIYWSVASSLNGDQIARTHLRRFDPRLGGAGRRGAQGG